MIGRVLALTVIGFGFVAALAWLTSWPFALYCYGALMASLHVHQAGTTLTAWADTPSPRAVGSRPLWMSSGGATLTFSLAALSLSLFAVFLVMTPLLIGAIWFRWWWGLVGLPLGVLGAGLSLPKVPGPVRLGVGSIVCVGAAVALVL